MLSFSCAWRKLYPDCSVVWAFFFINIMSQASLEFFQLPKIVFISPFFYYMLGVPPPPAKQPPIDGKKYAFRCSSAQVYSHFFIIFILRVLYGGTRDVECAAAAVVQALRDGNDEKRDLSAKEIWMCVCCVGNKKKIFFSHSPFSVLYLLCHPSSICLLSYLSESKLPCTRCCLQSADAEKIFGTVEMKKKINFLFRKNLIFSLWKENHILQWNAIKINKFPIEMLLFAKFQGNMGFSIHGIWWMIDDEWEMRHFHEIFLSFIFSFRCLRYEQTNGGNFNLTEFRLENIFFRYIDFLSHFLTNMPK